MHLNILLIVTVVIQWVLKLDRGAGTCTGGPHMHVPARTFCDAINQYDTLQIYRRLSFALNGTSESSNCSKWLVHGVIVITSRHHICLGSEEPRFTSQKVIVTSSGVCLRKVTGNLRPRSFSTRVRQTKHLHQSRAYLRGVEKNNNTCVINVMKLWRH